MNKADKKKELFLLPLPLANYLYTRNSEYFRITKQQKLKFEYLLSNLKLFRFFDSYLLDDKEQKLYPYNGLIQVFISGGLPEELFEKESEKGSPRSRKSPSFIEIELANNVKVGEKEYLIPEELDRSYRLNRIYFSFKELYALANNDGADINSRNFKDFYLNWDNFTNVGYRFEGVACERVLDYFLLSEMYVKEFIEAVGTKKENEVKAGFKQAIDFLKEEESQFQETRRKRREVRVAEEIERLKKVDSRKVWKIPNFEVEKAKVETVEPSSTRFLDNEAVLRLYNRKVSMNELEHTSEGLDVLKEVIAEFWEGVEPDIAAKSATNEAIVSYVKHTHPEINPTLAKYIAMIVRPDKYKPQKK